MGIVTKRAQMEATGGGWVAADRVVAPGQLGRSHVDGSDQIKTSAILDLIALKKFRLNPPQSPDSPKIPDPGLLRPRPPSKGR